MKGEAVTHNKVSGSEGIRAWYHRKTKNSVRALIGATVLTAIVALSFYLFAELQTLMRMQTFNGAITIPAAGFIWLLSFTLIWLIPMREVSFRGQESMERMEDRIIPAIATWQRVGERMEKEILPSLEALVQELQRKAIPVLDNARRIEASIEAELQTGILQDFRDASRSVKTLVVTHGPTSGPDMARALEGLTSRKGGKLPTLKKDS